MRLGERPLKPSQRLAPDEVPHSTVQRLARAWSVPQQPCSETNLRAANRDNGSKEAKRIKDVGRGIPVSHVGGLQFASCVTKTAAQSKPNQ